MQSETSSRPQTASWLFLILANVLWATSYVTSKIVLQELSVPMLLALRLGLAGCILLPFLIFKRKEFHLTRRDLWPLALLSLIGFILNKLLEFGGLALSTASDIALLIAAESLFTAALSWWLLREKFRWRMLISLLIGFVGVYLVVGQGLLPTLSGQGGITRLVGDLLIVLALLSEAFYTVRGKVLLTRYSPLLVTAAAIVGSLFFWGPVAGWEVLRAGWPRLSLISWFCLVWLALMTTVIAYLAWFHGLSQIESSRASSTLLIQPLLGTMLAVLLLHDGLTRYTIIGGVLIVISVYNVGRRT